MGGKIGRQYNTKTIRRLLYLSTIDLETKQVVKEDHFKLFFSLFNSNKQVFAGNGLPTVPNRLKMRCANPIILLGANSRLI